MSAANSSCMYGRVKKDPMHEIMVGCLAISMYACMNVWKYVCMEVCRRMY